MKRLLLLALMTMTMSAACGGSKKPATAPTTGSGAPTSEKKMEAGSDQDKPDTKGDPSAAEDPCAVPPQ